MSISRISSIFTVSFFLSAVFSSAVLACRGAPKLGKVDRSWIKNTTTIYGVTHKGQIFRTRFGSNKIEILADHHFNHINDVHVSADRRYVLYEGSVGDNLSSEYLYDINTGKERVLPKPAYGYYYPTFSPVSDLILLRNMYRARNELALFDPSNQQIKSIPYPEALADGAPRWYFGDWSQDGRSIYVISGIDHDGFYKFDLATETYTRFDGHQTRNGGEIIENGKSIHVYDYDGCSMQSMCSDPALKSPDGRFVARVEKDSSLAIEAANRRPIPVETGEYSQCFGESIRPLAWLGNDYVIYTSHGLPYVYGLKENKRSALFQQKFVEFYFW